MDDFNARTTSYAEFISDEREKFVPCNNTDHDSQLKERRSFDDVLNTNGKWLLELCRMLD